MDLTGVSNRRLLEQILINTHTMLRGEINIMATQADFDAALAQENTDLNGYIAAVSALVAKLNAGASYTAELATVTAQDAAITAAQAGLTAPTPPPAPPTPPPTTISP